MTGELSVDLDDLYASARRLYGHSEDFSSVQRRAFARLTAMSGLLPGRSSRALTSYSEQTGTEGDRLYSRMTDHWTQMRGFGISTEQHDQHNGQRMRDTQGTGVQPAGS
ncbi:MAG: hypothetical protein WAV90_15765, partial [Gordonia amarae]